MISELMCLDDKVTKAKLHLPPPLCPLCAGSLGSGGTAMHSIVKGEGRGRGGGGGAPASQVAGAKRFAASQAAALLGNAKE